VWVGVPGGRASFAEATEDLSGDLSGDGLAFLRLAVRGDDERSVGRAFSGAVVETSLASYPGLFSTTAPGPAQAVARYWPTTIVSSEVAPLVECEGETVPTRPVLQRDEAHRPADAAEPLRARTSRTTQTDAHEASPRLSVPLWVLIGGRSGDKGGNANIGLWADSDAVAQWLCDAFDVAQFEAALPEAAPFDVQRHVLSNLRAVNFVVRGILGWGVASNLRLDSQAKGLAELLRSRSVEVPSGLVATGKPAARWATLRQQR
jgi:hypothetical protein